MTWGQCLLLTFAFLSIAANLGRIARVLEKARPR